MGIEVVQSEQLSFLDTAGEALDVVATGWDSSDKPIDVNSTSTRACVAWVKNSLILGEAPKLTVSIDKRPDLRNSWQAYASIGVGAVRMDEAGVIMVPCLEA